MRLDTSIFTRVRKEYEDFDTSRERIITEGRTVIKLSKQLIYALHRGEELKADASKRKIDEAVKRLLKAARGPELRYSGIVRNALQEYVEAVCFHSVQAKGMLPTPSSIGVDSESYLLGICDLTGELGRSAVHSVIKDDVGRFQEIKSIVSGIFEQLLKFDFRNSELRRKFDSVKYTVKKLEDIELDLTLRKRR